MTTCNFDLNDGFRKPSNWRWILGESTQEGKVNLRISVYPAGAYNDAQDIKPPLFVFVMDKDHPLVVEMTSLRDRVLGSLSEWEPSDDKVLS
jgi:hypothetical protein